jgi:hypothetical protein
MLEKTASRGRPSCSWIMANASSSGKGGTSSCNHTSSRAAHLMSHAQSRVWPCSSRPTGVLANTSSSGEGGTSSRVHASSQAAHLMSHAQSQVWLSRSRATGVPTHASSSNKGGTSSCKHTSSHAAQHVQVPFGHVAAEPQVCRQTPAHLVTVTKCHKHKEKRIQS